MASEDKEIEREFGDWLEHNWSPSLGLREWRRILVDSGWGRPSWPVEWHGRGLWPRAELIVAEQLRRVGAVGVAPGAGTTLAGPTILAHGPDRARERFLRPLLVAEHRWCQLFSEPSSGSDLASLATRAERDGEGWVVNGTKVWSSGAADADFGLLLARTNPNVDKRAGISYFALDMRQPGVSTSKIHQMNGHSSFYEVHLDGVRVSSADLIGDLDDGWRVARTTLMFERRLHRVDSLAVPTFARGAAAEEARAEVAATLAPYVWYAQRTGRPDLAPDLAARLGRNDDPIARQQLAQLATLTSCAQWSAARFEAARAPDARRGAEGSLSKLHSSLIARLAARVHGSVGGLAGLQTDADGLEGGIVAEILLSVPAMSIAGGTDEIQKNIVGERLAGLPKEPQ